jgi:hypothetical protein
MNRTKITAINLGSLKDWVASNSLINTLDEANILLNRPKNK